MYHQFIEFYGRDADWLHFYLVIYLKVIIISIWHFYLGVILYFSAKVENYLAFFSHRQSAIQSPKSSKHLTSFIWSIKWLDCSGLCRFLALMPQNSAVCNFLYEPELIVWIGRKTTIRNFFSAMKRSLALFTAWIILDDSKLLVTGAGILSFCFYRISRHLWH